MLNHRLHRLLYWNGGMKIAETCEIFGFNPCNPRLNEFIRAGVVKKESRRIGGIHSKQYLMITLKTNAYLYFWRRIHYFFSNTGSIFLKIGYKLAGQVPCS